jgi:SAM-dependent methyltransferase
VIKGGLVKDLREISSINISRVSVTEAVLLLDSFIFSMHRIRPTAEDLKLRFGPASPTYHLTFDALQTLWEMVKDESDVKLKLDLWAKNMEIVYGSKPQVESFIAHTYLVTLVKLIVYLRLSGDNTAKKEDIKKALSGECFTSWGIANLIEEDYFTWLLHPKIMEKALKLCCGLTKELLRYDFSQIDEDFFKEIYQEIVERGERHRIGEYYTPEWLCELTFKEALEAWKGSEGKKIPRILDAFCGSGTFLCSAVRWMKNKLMSSSTPQDQALNLILDSVVGVDINPLAVTIARVNYLMALGELLHGKTAVIPVYLSDSINLPNVREYWSTVLNQIVGVYDIEVNGLHLQIPTMVAKNRPTLGKVLKGFRVALEDYRTKKKRGEANSAFKNEVASLLSQGEFEVFLTTLNRIFDLVDKGRDAIWPFILSNLYAPVALMDAKFDILVSNPPWIAMRYVENSSYQDFLKQQVLKYQLLKSDQVELFTHMEMATLCFCRSADLYLKDQGVIAFVMPRSVLTGAFHHERFRSLSYPSMKLVKILDLEYVSPLFNVPSCVLIAVKGGSTSYPVLARRYSGVLEEKNAKLSEALKNLIVEDYGYEPPKIPLRKSFYHDRVKQGATIVPRSLWFVEFEVQQILGSIDVRRPKVRTSNEVKAEAKKPWTDIELEGNIEADFIYATLLGGDLVPFGYTKMRPIVIPAEPGAGRFTLLNVKALRNRGAVGMASWLEKAQSSWEKHRTKKGEERFKQVIDRLNYQQLLTIQSPNRRYVVLYNTSGTNLVSCVVSKQSLPAFRVDGAKIAPKNFIAESTTYFYETDDEREAHYICAVLNAPAVNEAIKPLQPRGLWGERHIHRRPFMLPIPRFDGSNPKHIRLAELSMSCHVKVASLNFTKTTPARAREEARRAVSKELAEIDKIVRELLQFK